MSANGLSTRLARFTPDPFVLAAALTLVVFTPCAILMGPGVASTAWLDGFFATPLLAFAFQMCLVLVTGQALASSSPVRRLVRSLAALPKTSAQAVFLVGAVACTAAVIHWGLGAVVGALLAREVSVTKTRYEVSTPILGAAAYSGMAVWHGGFSGSAPLSVAQPDHFAAHIAVVPVGETLLSPLNLIVTGGLCILLPAVFMMLSKVGSKDAAATPRDMLIEHAESIDDSSGSPGSTAEEQSSNLTRAFGLAGVIAVVSAWVGAEFALNLNTVNGFFLFLGITAHGNLARYTDAVCDAARGAGAILIQFPFYFGILGLLKSSGAIADATSFIVDIASSTTLAPLAFVLAGVTNFLVPSGGGQWVVQGELLLSAAEALDVNPATIVLAFSYGDAWTNLLQPFWALPLLAIMGLRAKDIIGFTALAALIMGVFVTIALLI